MTDKYYRITDDQWEVIREYLPVQRKRRHDLREIFNAILWITRTGSQWRNLDSSFPHWRAVYYYFDQWSKKGLIGQINQALNELARIQVAKAAGKVKPPLICRFDSRLSYSDLFLEK